MLTWTAPWRAVLRSRLSCSRTNVGQTGRCKHSLCPAPQQLGRRKQLRQHERSGVLSPWPVDPPGAACGLPANSSVMSPQVRFTPLVCRRCTYTRTRISPRRTFFSSEGSFVICYSPRTFQKKISRSSSNQQLPRIFELRGTISNTNTRTRQRWLAHLLMCHSHPYSKYSSLVYHSFLWQTT